jgi:hypothetical protein
MALFLRSALHRHTRVPKCHRIATTVSGLPLSGLLSVSASRRARSYRADMITNYRKNDKLFRP